MTLLQSKGISVSMAAVGCPEENGFAERWMRTLKEEHVQMSEYEDYWDAQSQIGVFIEEVYQKKRVHSRLGYLPPAVFEERWRSARAASEVLLSDASEGLAATAMPESGARTGLSGVAQNVTIP